MEKANAKDYLGKEVSIIIDRQLVSRYYKHGFIPNTISVDGKIIKKVEDTIITNYKSKQVTNHLLL